MAAVPGRSALLGDIQSAPKLRKVSAAEKRDRSTPVVPGGAAEASAASAPGGANSGGGDTGLAGALASALAARKAKVSHSGEYFFFIGIHWLLHLLITIHRRRR